MSKSSKKKTATKTKPAKKGKAVAKRADEKVIANDASAAETAATAEAVKTPKPKKVKTDKPKRTSALDSAAQILREAKAPMRCKEMVAAMQAQGLWTSPNGRTPEATLYSAILREISKKGDASRFCKLDRGLFEANA
jgi:hypothetical protein